VACFKLHKEVCKKDEKPATTETQKPDHDPSQAQSTQTEANTISPHTAVNVAVVPSPQLTTPQPQVVSISTHHDDMFDSYRVPGELLLKIGQEAQLVKALQEPSLQQLISSIDSAHNPEECLKQAMIDNPQLHNFVDNMLKTMGLRDEQSHSTIM
jgi:hypothetical protein